MNPVREEIVKRLSSINDLPTRSVSMARLCDALKESHGTAPDFAEIVDIVEHDVGLAARLIRIANSPRYAGRYDRITSIHQAINRIGLDKVSKICLAVSAMQLFPSSSSLLDLADFWVHSISVAMTIREIAMSKKRTPDIESLYSAGLFHDVGALILDRYFPEHYRRTRDSAHRDGVAVYDAERRHLGIDHGEVGSLLLDRWGLTGQISAAAAFHHFPHEASESYVAVAQVVHLADFACGALGAFEPGDSQPQESSLSAWDECGIDIERMREIISRAQERIGEAGDFVELVNA